MSDLMTKITLVLEKLNVQFELIEPKTWEKLEKIEDNISRSFVIQENAKSSLKNNRPSINNIATKAKIARQTIYNNELLKKYIEFRIAEYNDFDPAKRNEKILERISELEEKVKLMTERDVSVELMRRKIILLEDKMKNVKKEKKELQERYNSLKQNNDKGNKEQKQRTPIVTALPKLI